MRNARAHGLTLIEVLVVVAIIAILAAILFPMFAKMFGGRNRAEIQQTLSVQLRSAVDSGRAENTKVGDLTFDILPYRSPDWHGKTGPVVMVKEDGEVVVVVIVWFRDKPGFCSELVDDLGSRYKKWTVVRAKLGLPPR